jgi:hypothetical protein
VEEPLPRIQKVLRVFPMDVIRITSPILKSAAECHIPFDNNFHLPAKTTNRMFDWFLGLNSLVAPLVFYFCISLFIIRFFRQNKESTRDPGIFHLHIANCLCFFFFSPL